VISELDIFRAANLLIDRHGGDAVVEAAKMIDRMLELGDPEGRQVWRRIKAAIEQLCIEERGRKQFKRPAFWACRRVEWTGILRALLSHTGTGGVPTPGL
jgi:hypothetical protein